MAAMDSLSVTPEGYRNCSEQELRGNTLAAVELTVLALRRSTSLSRESLLDILRDP